MRSTSRFTDINYSHLTFYHVSDPSRNSGDIQKITNQNLDFCLTHNNRF